MAWLDFNQYQDDLVTLLQGVTTAELVKKECDERDYNFGNMPLIDVRLKTTTPEIRAGQDYYVFVTFEVQITAYDLSGFNEAATLRQTVMGEAIDLVRSNARFSSGIESSRIGIGEFANSKDDETGAFQAAATFEVITETFVDRS